MTTSDTDSTSGVSESGRIGDLDPTDKLRLEPKCRGLAMLPDGSICKLCGRAQVGGGGAVEFWHTLCEGRTAPVLSSVGHRESSQGTQHA
jgi:hypothetical protein